MEYLVDFTLTVPRKLNAERLAERIQKLLDDELPKHYDVTDLDVKESEE